MICEIFLEDIYDGIVFGMVEMFELLVNNRRFVFVVGFGGCVVERSNVKIVDGEILSG